MTKQQSPSESSPCDKAVPFRLALSGAFGYVIRETARVLRQEEKMSGENADPYVSIPLFRLADAVRDLAIMLEFCGQAAWARRLEKAWRGLPPSNDTFTRALASKLTWGVDFVDEDGKHLLKWNAHAVAYAEVARRANDLMETAGTMADVFFGGQRREPGLVAYRDDLEKWRRAKEEREAAALREIRARFGERKGLKVLLPPQTRRRVRKWGKVPTDWGLTLPELAEVKGVVSENWSRPMALRDISDRVFGNPDQWKKVKSVYRDRLEKINRKTWRFRPEGMGRKIEEAFDRP